MEELKKDVEKTSQVPVGGTPSIASVPRPHIAMPTAVSLHHSSLASGLSHPALPHPLEFRSCTALISIVIIVM